MPTGGTAPGKRSFATAINAKGTAKEIRKQACSAVKEGQITVNSPTLIFTLLVVDLRDTAVTCHAPYLDEKYIV